MRKKNKYSKKNSKKYSKNKLKKTKASMKRSWLEPEPEPEPELEGLKFVIIDSLTTGTGSELHDACKLIQEEIGKVVPIETMRDEDENAPTYFIHFVEKKDLEEAGYTSGSNPGQATLTEYIWSICNCTRHSNFLWTDSIANAKGEPCFLKWVHWVTPPEEGSCILFEMDNKDYYQGNDVVVTDIPEVSETLQRDGITIEYNADEDLGFGFGPKNKNYPSGIKKVKENNPKFNPKSRAIPEGSWLIGIDDIVVSPSIKAQIAGETNFTLDMFKEKMKKREGTIILKFSPAEWTMMSSPLGTKAGFGEACYNWIQINDRENICARRGYSGARGMSGVMNDRDIDSYIFTREAYDKAQLRPILCIDINDLKSRSKTKT